MRKRIICILMTAILSVSLFTGCSLFSYDSERDSMQVVATIAPVRITESSVLTGDEEYTGKVYQTEEKKIYKYELVSTFNNIGQTLVSNYGYTLEDAIDYVVDQLVTRQIILNEADAQISFGNVTWGQNEENQVLEGIYSSIDAQLASIRNSILESRGEETPGTSSSDSSSDSTDTTYPVQEVEEEGKYDRYSRNELISAAVERIEGLTQEQAEEYSDYKLRAKLEDADLQNVEKFKPDTVRYPGFYGSDKLKSLELEAMRRFISDLKDTVKEDFRISAADKKTYSEELENLEKLGNEKGLSYVYPELGDTKLMQYMIGDNYRTNVKIDLLQKHITDSVDVLPDEVQSSYNDLLAQQTGKYENVDSFYTDVKANNVDPMVYYANGDYYFVKHILVPFNDEQTAKLTAFKAGKGNIEGDASIAEFKEKLGKTVVGYEHRDGENYGLPLTIDEIYADIVREMAKVTELKDRDRKFDELIYKYNTDDGIFGKELGYPVKGKLGENEEYDSTYMEEFSRAADKLFREGKEGAISEFVATDYGVHLLYLSRIIPEGGMTVGLNQYISYGEHTTVYEKLESTFRTQKLNERFTKWQENKVGYYFTVATDVITRNEKAYENLKKSN